MDRKLSQVMHSVCRPYDEVGRYGGEEFCILLADTSLSNAVAFAERLRETIAATVVIHDGHALSVTVSIGIAQLGPQTPDITTLIECADQALVEAKRAGRNRVQPSTSRFAAIDQTFVRDLFLGSRRQG